MATSLGADHHSVADSFDHGTMGATDPGSSLDPFQASSGASSHHRYSQFDTQLFALGPAASPEQAKRALEAHLTETDRRIQDASRLGTALVQQRKDLSDRLKEVEKQQGDGDITAELRKRLVDLEKEFNEVGRETARAFLPKSRVASNDIGASSFMSDGKRSVSPSKFESQATNSPSKLSVPNRKQRNQPSNRVHDIEFATEISTSLLSQVRHLQTLLAEKEESLKIVSLEKSKLETEAEGFSQRLRSLDESEHRYKDENWNLETQIHEHIASAKESADREKKLTQTLNTLEAEKSAAQKELDEIKLIHSRLIEDHTAAIKHHDVEFGGVKRSMAILENERAALQRKIEELANQNQELAIAVAQQRGRAEEQSQSQGLSDEDFETANDTVTPEHSPPPSPIKGTPRHSMLESETLKSSLHHAHRMIQNLKSNIHREKTEKVELKRMLQDARDELEMRRGEASVMSSTTKRSKKGDSKEFKKPLKPGQLGALRSSRSEVAIEDANWEDHNEGASPTQFTDFVTPHAATGGLPDGNIYAAGHVSGNAPENLQETSDSFETANERATETEDFHTGAETLSGSDDLTETEDGPSHVKTIRRVKAAPPLALTQAGSRNSFQSTASVSGDEYLHGDMRTPVHAQPQRFRLKMNRNSSRKSRVGSEEPQFASSPASFGHSSTTSTPHPPGQTLFSELGDLDRSDEDESMDGTPSRKSLATPGSFSVPATRTSSSLVDESLQSSLSSIPKLTFVDSGMMTEPWDGVTQNSKSSNAEVPGSEITGAGNTEVSSSIPDIHGASVLRSTSYMSETPSRWHGDELKNLLTPSSLQSDVSRPISGISGYSDMSSQLDANLDEKLARFPSPPTSPHHTPMASTSGTAAADSLSISVIRAEQVEPTPEFRKEPSVQNLAKATAFSVVPLAFSSIQSVNTEPVEPANSSRSPRRDGIIISGDKPIAETSTDFSEIQPEEPETPKHGFLGSVFPWSKSRPPATPVIAEDDTRQSPSQSPLIETPESQRPFKEMSINATERPPKTLMVEMNDEGSQTALTAQQIDKMLNTKSKQISMMNPEDGHPSTNSPPRSTTIPAALRVRKPHELVGSVAHVRTTLNDPDFVQDTITLKRPDSAGSNRVSSSGSHPPLPTNHQQVIAAAVQRVGSSNGGPGTMGPPLVPASAYRGNPTFRPRTPTLQGPTSPISTRGGTTPRAGRSSAPVEVSSPPGTANRSRRSSVSSFASEVDTRFNLRANGMLIPSGVESGADPRMIQAITQTMIGEYLWKYTRKTGRGDMSENRHRRYFWVHPYTRTLYWSDRDPSTAGRAELKAKSVAIEAVRVVTDDNPMPPGLHRKSLVILSPGRAVKITATTGQRHETWFNALSYLLLRTDGTADDNPDLDTGVLTREDVDEFNPGYRKTPIRPQPAASLSSYNSRTTRNESPVGHSIRLSMNPPTLAHDSTVTRQSQGTISRLSNYWKPSATFSSRRSRTSVGGHGSIYNASEVHDSAEDLREMIEKQDRESDKLENVRACCDGKHDVGSLSHSSKKKRHSRTHNHTHHGPSASQKVGGPSRQSLSAVVG